ncbi:unnamed protein product, partial [Scytosiphon promiscuus]
AWVPAAPLPSSSLSDCGELHQRSRGGACPADTSSSSSSVLFVFEERSSESTASHHLDTGRRVCSVSPLPPGDKFPFELLSFFPRKKSCVRVFNQGSEGKDAICYTGSRQHRRRRAASSLHGRAVPRQAGGRSSREEQRFACSSAAGDGRAIDQLRAERNMVGVQAESRMRGRHDRDSSNANKTAQLQQRQTLQSSRGGVFGSLRSLIRGKRSKKATARPGKSKSSDKKKPTGGAGASDVASSNRPREAKKESGGGKGGEGGGGSDNTPSSQSSFFSGRTGEASLSSGASTPVGPASLSPSPASSLPSSSQPPQRQLEEEEDALGAAGVDGGEGREVGGGESTYRSGGARGNDASAPGGDEWEEDGEDDGRYVTRCRGHSDVDGAEGGDREPPSYHSLFLSRPREQEQQRPDDDGDDGYDNGSSSDARYYEEGPRRDQPHILEKAAY